MALKSVANPFKKSDNTHRAIWAQRTQNLLAKSGTEKFRENIKKKRGKADGG